MVYLLVKNMQISVRLNRDLEEFIRTYSKINGTSVSTSIRELLHYFKLIVALLNGFEELRKIVKDNVVYENGNGMKVNVTLNNSDIEFLDNIAKILKTNRSTALRFCISSLYYILMYSVH